MTPPLAESVKSMGSVAISPAEIASPSRGTEPANRLRVLDLFSAAAGGWSLGMHRAGFQTVAACEVVDWRRALYAENNPDVRLYDDVRALTGARLHSDLGFVPDVVVGSPPCQDISSADTKGKGVDGERSGLFFEAVRLVGEIRPRWVALENSANLRTRGADRVLAALEGLGYAHEAVVVRAGHGRGGAGVGANHERPRAWIIAHNLDTPCIRHDGWRARRHGQDGNPSPPATRTHGPDPDQAGQADGCMVASLRQAEIARAGRGDQPTFGPDAMRAGPVGRHALGGRLARQVEAQDEHGGCVDATDPCDPWPGWNGGFARHLRMDDGLSALMARTRVAVGGPRGTIAARLVVEAYGDAVCPQIPEAIGRAILRTEAALSAIYARAAA